MKTYTKVLYENHYSSPLAFGEIGEKVESYVIFKMHFDFKEGLRFSIQVPNRSWCKRNPFKLWLIALESEGIGYAKYQRLKSRCQENIEIWHKL